MTTSQFVKANIWGVCCWGDVPFSRSRCKLSCYCHRKWFFCEDFVSEWGLQTLTWKTLAHFLVDSTHFETRCLDFAAIVKENNWISTEGSCKTNCTALQPKREASRTEKRAFCILPSLVMKLTDCRYKSVRLIKIQLSLNYFPCTLTHSWKRREKKSIITLLSTKLYLSDLKTQFVPRSKHSLPLL